jgi:transcription antitermination factor NusG
VPPAKKRVPYIPGYIFVPHKVEIHRVKSHPEARLWMAALVINGKAVTISDDDMCKMRDIPDTLKARLEQIEEQIRKEREAKRPVLGGLATIVDGVMAGQRGTVIGLQRGEVKIDTGGILGHVMAPVEIVERVA